MNCLFFLWTSFENRSELLRRGRVGESATTRSATERPRILHRALCIVGLCGFLAAPASASPVAVRYKQGLLHGFLTLSTLGGTPIADGELLQTPHGESLTTRLIFRFKDGSLQDETAVFTQRGYFKLLNYHLIQKGPTFPRAIDMSIAVSSGQATVHYTDDDGKQKEATEHLELPPDLANGLFFILFTNLRSSAAQTDLSMVVATPKPRVVKVAVSSQGTEPFTVGTTAHKATHYVAKIEIGGLTGLVAPLVGKQPPDSHIWVMEGDAPVLVKSESLSYMGGPVWRMEIAAPTWPGAGSAEPKSAAETKK